MNSSLLAQAYTDLEYDKGELTYLHNHNMPLCRELDMGDWIIACNKINKKSNKFVVESIFFVKDNPVIIFGICNSTDDTDIEQAYINVWNLARPQYFFLERNGQLIVYDLSIPIKTLNGKRVIPKPIELIKTANDILRKLQNLSRHKIEGGISKLDKDNREYRADKTLINDIKKIRAELMKHGLGGDRIKYAHSIIGRSIFIRYLEDRGILTREYFSDLASQNKVWANILAMPLDNCLASDVKAKDGYIKCLRDKKFTYALYRKLSHDFNGDMFPIDDTEESIVTSEHLLKISDFLQGKFDEQLRLFFWSYKFDVIPMELMSNLYEEFYHKQNENDGNGTHYTPLSLVEFVIKQALPVEVLVDNPKVLDTCCGSGIFLVESFKRIVRYNIIRNNGVLLTYGQLKEILKKQIRGIELEDEALRVAAFSLYVAFLDFQETPCILKQIKNGRYLPNLKYNKDISSSFDILLCGDAFSDEATSFIGEEKANIIVGNPPWGRADSSAIKWCKTNKFPLGDKEYSQAFIWRAIQWTKSDGAICLLLPTSVFSKLNPKSNLFKKEWFSKTTLLQVVNFAHSRDVFFHKASAPFVSVLFRPQKPVNDGFVLYWSAKKSSKNIERQYIVYGKSDMHFIKQSQFSELSYAWKTLWWGGLSDLSLIGRLKANNSTIKFVEENSLIKQGYTPGKGNTKSIEKLSKFKRLSLNGLVSLGKIDKFLVDDSPKELHRNFSSFEIFEGNRIIVKRGISKKGTIVSRVEVDPFSFTNGIHCIKFQNNNDVLSKSICAILLSSVARYYFFLTSSGWGMWHDEIHLEELEQFPIPPIYANEHTKKLSLLMDEIKEYEDITLGSPAKNDQRSFETIIRDIDEVVFKMYQLTDEEKALVIDMCSYGLDLFYNKSDSIAIKELPAVPGNLYGTVKDLQDKKHLIFDYMEMIVSAINGYLLNINGELEWRIYRSKGVIGVLFLTKYLNDPVGVDYGNKDDWEEALGEFSRLSKQAVTDSIYVEGSFVGVSDSCIAIIKKDEHRNWSAGAAVKDLNSVLLKLIDKQSVKVNGNE